MNAYTTMGQTRIQHRDLVVVRGKDWFTAAASLTALERQRSGQAEAEVAVRR
jgi:hypothetical protein